MISRVGITTHDRNNAIKVLSSGDAPLLTQGDKVASFVLASEGERLRTDVKIQPAGLPLLTPKEAVLLS